MKLTPPQSLVYNGLEDGAVFIPDLRLTVVSGVPFDCPGDFAASLLAQGVFTTAPTPAPAPEEA